jgi:hypothetical protein
LSFGIPWNIRGTGGSAAVAIPTHSADAASAAKVLFTIPPLG